MVINDHRDRRKDKTQECLVFFFNEYEVDLLTKVVLGGCRSDNLFVCHQQVTCQVKHLFNTSTVH